MDARVRQRVTDMQQALGGDEQHLSLADPIAKMMLVAMAHQSCEIERKIDQTVDRLAVRFAGEMLQSAGMMAQPAVTVAHVGNGRENSAYHLSEKDTFTYKPTQCTYRPIFRSRILPGNIAACFMNDMLLQPGTNPIPATWPDPKHKNEVWLAYDAFGETKTLEDVTVAVSSPFPQNGLTAEVGDLSIPLTLLMEDMPRTLNSNFMLTEYWKRSLVQHGLWLYRFGKCPDKRVLRRSEIPAWIRDAYEPEFLETFVGHQYLWIRIKAIKPCALPLDSTIIFNCIPLANYDIHNAKLSYTEPLHCMENEKLGRFFVGVAQEGELSQEYFIRDFDVSQYDNERIREDITSMYHHFVDDYFAFVDINALHDGATLRSLRQSMMQVYDSLESFQTERPRPYGGIYAIRNPRYDQQPIVITYYTSNGDKGNALMAGGKLEASNAAPGEVEALFTAVGGRDKMNSKMAKRELARFAVTTNNRLFTRMDLIQYCRLELIRAFGDEVATLCKVSMEDGNMVVDDHIEKCVTIKFSFASDNLRMAAQNSDFFSYLQINIDLRKSFAWNVVVEL